MKLPFVASARSMPQGRQALPEGSGTGLLLSYEHLSANCNSPFSLKLVLGILTTASTIPLPH